jgi:glutamate racemase
MRPIGVFDSGFGGLSVLKHIVRQLPQYDYCYFGDNARAPYGSRNKGEVYEFTREGVEFLFKKGAPLVILACNTASSEALRRLQREWLPKKFPERRILGVLIPASEEAAKRTKNGRIGVIGTTGTVKSKSFIRELRKEDSRLAVYQVAMPLLVPFVEAGRERSLALRPILEECLMPLTKRGIDTLILGCTHYGFLKGKISRAMGEGVRLIESGPVVAKKLEAYMKQHSEIELCISTGGQRLFYTSDRTGFFNLHASRYFGGTARAGSVVL